MNTFFENVFAELAQVFQPEQLGTILGEWLVQLTSAVLVYLIFYLVWLLVSKLVISILNRSHQDQTTRVFIRTIVKYAILIIGGLTALKVAGLDISAVLASLGIAGITIGFAARDAFSNLISGLLIFLDRPFVIGDFIEAGENYGRVDQITLRSTRIVTPDGRMLAVPNTEMINKTVASYSNFPNLRLDMSFTIGVNEDIHQVRNLVLDAISADQDLLSDPEPKVLVTALNDYNIELELQVWLENERVHVEKRADLLELLLDTLRAAEIEMPYETIQITGIESSPS